MSKKFEVGQRVVVVDPDVYPENAPEGTVGTVVGVSEDGVLYEVEVEVPNPRIDLNPWPFFAVEIEAAE